MVITFHPYHPNRITFNRQVYCHRSSNVTVLIIVTNVIQIMIE